jgi:hypothetical protein
MPVSGQAASRIKTVRVIFMASLRWSRDRFGGVGSAAELSRLLDHRSVSKTPEDSPKSEGKAACCCSIAIGRHHHNRAALDRGPGHLKVPAQKNP